MSGTQQVPEPWSMSDKIALAALAVAVVSLVITAFSVWWGRAAAKASERSAEAGDKSAEASRDSAGSARRSADAAAALTELDQDRRQQEREERHDDLAPGRAPGEIVGEVRRGSASETLIGSILIEVPRGYRVKADAIFVTGGSTQLSIGPVLHANQSVEFQIEQWPTGSREPKTKEIRFRFWPSVEGDEVDAWSCRCGKPGGESVDGPGHWEWRVPVSRRVPGVRGIR